MNGYQFYIHNKFYLCIKQINKRREEQPERSSLDTEEMFYHVTKYFEIPLDSEELNVKVVNEKR